MAEKEKETAELPTRKFSAKLYAVDTRPEKDRAKSGRVKVGETAIVEAVNVLDAAEKVLKLIRDGITEDADRAGLDSFTIRLDASTVEDSNPFAKK